MTLPYISQLEQELYILRTITGNRDVLCLKVCCCFIEPFGNSNTATDARTKFVRARSQKNTGEILFITFKVLFFLMHAVTKMLSMVFLLSE